MKEGRGRDEAQPLTSSFWGEIFDLMAKVAFN
jgi:hypothetical protein